MSVATEAQDNTATVYKIMNVEVSPDCSQFFKLR